MIDNYNLNPNQLQYNGINPNAMGNMQTLQGMNGTQMPNTFNRTVGTSFTGVDPVPTQYVTPSVPVTAPQNVQTQIMPDNNLQTY
jgi:hypothetical protein